MYKFLVFSSSRIEKKKKKKVQKRNGWATAQLCHDTMELYRDTAVMGVQLGCRVSVSRYTQLYRDKLRLDRQGESVS